MRPRNSLVFLVIAACSGPVAGTSGPTITGAGSGVVVAPDAPPVDAAPTTITGTPIASDARLVSLAEVGLEADSLDTTADPCVDFYQFACGGWIAKHPVPDDHAVWSRFSEVHEQTTERLGALLATATGKLGDFHQACLATDAIEKAGLAPLAPTLTKLRAVSSPKGWLAALIELHKVGVGAVFSTVVDIDIKDPGRYAVYVDAGGLALPSRDYYVDAGFADELAAYKAHVGRFMKLVDPARGESAATDVVAIETALAKHTKTAEQARDIASFYNPTSPKKLAKTTKSVDWKAYWKALSITPGKQVVVGTPAYFAKLDALRKQFKPAQWSNYFVYHYVAALAFQLPAAFDEEMFQLAKVTRGVQAQRPRAKRCVDATAEALPDLLGEAYVAAHFPPTARQQATELFAALAAVMDAELATTEWLSAATRTVARQKLAATVRMIGYPDRWRPYTFDVKADDFAGNTLRALAAETKRVMSRAGKSVDRGEWYMNAYSVDAYYSPAENRTALPAGILQAPFFDAGRSVAANLGGVGMVMGHELTHGFDDQGSQFDSTGLWKSWWTSDDATQFAARTTCVAEQYSTFEVLPKTFINGQLTVGENVADIGGVKMAFKAYRQLRANATDRTVAEGFDEDQQFFIAAGQAWCSRERKQYLEQLLVSDPHAPPKFRVYGALRNNPEFARAFKCAPGTPMNPSKTCTVW